MQHQHCRMWAGTGRNVEYRIHLGPMARNVRPSHRRRIRGFRRRVRDYRRRSLFSFFLRMDSAREPQYRAKQQHKTAKSFHEQI
jgi:hypothetical protein